MRIPRFIFSPARSLRDKKREHIFLYVCGAIFFMWGAYYITCGAPWSAPSNVLINIKQGSTVSDASMLLEKRHLIHSAFILRGVSRVLYGDKQLVAGEYSFNHPQNVFTIAKRLAEGDFELLPIKVTIQEGATVKDITQILHDKLPDFDSSAFYTLAVSHEGHLFPDTYFFLPGEEPDLVLKAFTNNFDIALRDVTVSLPVSQFNKPFNQVLTMASLLEKEAGDTQNRRIIAGILWKRISLDMPLQVDATFQYFLGKNTYAVTKADLQNASPYNTYTHKGLPPGPIANPGVDAIRDAVTPITTKYLYYLSDRHGNLYFAETYAQFLINKQKYI